MKTPAPIEASMEIDDKGNVQSVAWKEHYNKRQDHYEQIERHVDPSHSDFGKAEPAENVRRTGLMAFANGTDWDPAGDGTSGYFYYTSGGTWKHIA